MSRTSLAGSDRRTRSFRVAGSCSLALAAAMGLHLFRFALTPSLPRGVYLALPPRAGEYQRGDIVSFCPPYDLGRILLERHLAAPGRCPAGTVPLAKRVAAIAPHACSTPAGLTLDGRLLPWPALAPSLRLPHYRGCGPTPADCAFVLGDFDSIDSRVFGCIPTQRFLNRLLPILTERQPS